MVNKMARMFLFLLFLNFVFQMLLLISFSDVKKEESDIISAIIAVIPIVVIVLILLYLGGLLKAPTGRINWVLVFYFILIVVIFVLPILQRIGYIKIFPDNPEELFKDEKFAEFKVYKLPNPICNTFKSLNISESVACYMPAFIYFFLLPFTAIYVVTWAFLKQLKIFEGLERNLEGIMAFIITFMTLPMGTFMLLIALWFSFAGAFSIAVFIAMFLAGIFFRGYGFISSEAYSAGLKIYTQRSKMALRKLRALLEEFDELSTDKIREELKDLREAFRDLDAFTQVIPSKSEINSLDKNSLKQKINELIKKLES